MTCGKQDGDSNNNREKKKRGKDKRDAKGKKYLNKQKMSSIASSLNKNVSFRKINTKQKINNFSNSKRNEGDIFDLEKVIKRGSKCKGNTTARNMSILSASLPEIMDIIRNATGMNGEKAKHHRKKAMVVNSTE